MREAEHESATEACESGNALKRFTQIAQVTFETETLNKIASHAFAKIDIELIEQHGRDRIRIANRYRWNIRWQHLGNRSPIRCDDREPRSHCF